MEHRDAMAVITSDGSVTWIPPAIFKSTCEIDTTNFRNNFFFFKQSFLLLIAYVFISFRRTKLFHEIWFVDLQWKFLGPVLFRV